MINAAERKPVQRYFYGSAGPKILVFVSILLMLTIVLIPACLIGIIAAGIWMLIEKYGMNSYVENHYDALISEDFIQLNKRALDKLGLVDEQVSIIEPVKAYGPFFDYKTEAVARKKSKGLIGAIKLLLGDYIPSLIVKLGSDGRARYSMVSANIFIFNENQIYVYNACYDICNGEIIEESSAELFYKDIDCVIAGEEHREIIARKKIVKKNFEYFKVIVTSGSFVRAYVDSERVSILDNQVMAARELIRNKKEEISI